MRTVIVVLGGWLVVALLVMCVWSLFARTVAGLRPPLSPEARRRRRLVAAQVLLLVGAFALVGSEGALIVALAYLVDRLPVDREGLASALDSAWRGTIRRAG